MEIAIKNQSLEAKPQTALTHSLQREIDLSAGSQWNLQRAAEQLKSSPSAIQAMERELILIQEILIPSSPEQILTCLGKLLLHYPMTNMTTHEKTMLLEDYIDDLSRYPADMLEQVCREYRLDKKNEFFPKIGPLNDLVAAKYRPHLKRKSAIERLLLSISEINQADEPKPSLQDWGDIKKNINQEPANEAQAV